LKALNSAVVQPVSILSSSLPASQKSSNIYSATSSFSDSDTKPVFHFASKQSRIMPKLTSEGKTEAGLIVKDSQSFPCTSGDGFGDTSPPEIFQVLSIAQDEASVAGSSDLDSLLRDAKNLISTFVDERLLQLSTIMPQLYSKESLVMGGLTSGNEIENVGAKSEIGTGNETAGQKLMRLEESKSVYTRSVYEPDINKHKVQLIEVCILFRCSFSRKINFFVL
jgi:hypothetical protein